MSKHPSSDDEATLLLLDLIILTELDAVSEKSDNAGANSLGSINTFSLFHKFCPNTCRDVSCFLDDLRLTLFSKLLKSFSINSVF